MKLTTALAAAFAGCTAAAQQDAKVYMLPEPNYSATQSVPRNIARLVLMQRLAQGGEGPSTSEIPDDADLTEVVSLMNGLGKTPAPLFGDEVATTPRQLVVMVEGMTKETLESMDTTLGMQPTFSISDPPSDAAHEKLATNDFWDVGVTTKNDCSLFELANPSQDACWSGKSAYKRLNAAKDADKIDELVSRFNTLRKLAEAGKMETTIVVLPAVAETSSTQDWSDKPQELRRRQMSEQVMSIYDEEEPAAPTSEPSSNQVFYASQPPVQVQSCFASEDSCSTSTGNCSGHGSCQNKYAQRDGSEGKEVCYQCFCLSTVKEGSGSLTHWAGATCSKEDVSVAFWLFAGFTLVMVSILYMAIGLLFSVGEEKLPGVIGAGVSRSK